MLRHLVLGCVLICACDAIPLTREVESQAFDTVAGALDRREDAKVLEFSAAIPRVDLLGYKQWTNRGTRQTTATKRIAVMIPLVDEGWTPTQPVAVWVRLDAAAKSLEDPAIQRKIDEFVAATRAGPLRVNAVQSLPEDVDMDGTNAFTIGAKRAMLAHGLTSPVGAVLATWPAKTKGRIRLR